MTPYRRALLRRAIHVAGDTRATQGESLDRPLCVFDLAEKLGLMVEFKQYGNDYEGLFIPRMNSIHLEPGRPPGRQRFTCAHEIGHFVMKHGHVTACTTQEWSMRNTSQEELLANVFASFLLMPKIAVMKAFRSRSVTPQGASAEDYYRVSRWFGVGYTNLLWHCFRNLEVLSEERHEMLRKRPHPKIRESILEGRLPASDLNTDLYVASLDWQRPLDLRVGDRVLFDMDIGEALPRMLERDPEVPRLCRAAIPGTAVLSTEDGGWQVPVRVYDSSKHGWWRALWDIEEGE